MIEPERVVIRDESQEDWPAIAAINDRAFGGSSESALIAAIRRSGRSYVSLIALCRGGPVGHILFSPIHVHPLNVATLALAPMAVLPEFQGRGVGTLLVNTGLDVARRQGCQLVVVVGHPDYYPRFGFRAASNAGLKSVYSGAGDAFMVLEMVPGVLDNRGGVVEYPVEFATV